MKPKRIALSVIPALLAACTAGIAYRVPTTPPQGIAARQVDTDVVECEKAAPPGIDHRDWTYASCMIALGYTAYVEVPIWAPPATGKNVVAYNVRAARTHERAQTFADLSDCASRTEREARPNPALTVLTWPHSPVDFEAVERVYGGCMSERGYSVNLWRP